MPLSENSKGLLGLVALSFCFALFGPIARALAHELSLFQQIYTRLFLGYVVLLAFVPSARRLRAIPARDVWIVFGRAAAVYLLSVAPYTLATQRAPLGVVTFLAGLPLTGVWGMLLFGERPTALKLGAVAISLTGAGFICFAHGITRFDFGSGELLAILSAFAWSFGLSSRRYHSSAVTDGQLSSLMIGFGVIICLIASLAYGEGISIPTAARTWAILVFAAIIIAAAAVLIHYSLARVSHVTAGGVLLLECLIALILGALLYGELPTHSDYLGGALIIGGVILLAVVEGLRGVESHAAS